MQTGNLGGRRNTVAVQITANLNRGARNSPVPAGPGFALKVYILSGPLRGFQNLLAGRRSQK